MKKTKLYYHKCSFYAKYRIEKELQPDGYNIGMNCGEAAGKDVFHYYCHLITRFKKDVQNPREGIKM